MFSPCTTLEMRATTATQKTATSNPITTKNVCL